MAKIISKRGQKTVASAPASSQSTQSIGIIVIDAGDYTLNADELEHVRRVFEGIRKQLDAIVKGS